MAGVACECRPSLPPAVESLGRFGLRLRFQTPTVTTLLLSQLRTTALLALSL